jgi:ribose 5-phosphate isomerase B
MRIVFGADYKGVPYRDALMETLAGVGEVVDVAALEPTLTDYVGVAEKVVQGVSKDGDRGVIICGTGIGISIVANKHANISAARCVSVQDAIDSKVVNNANVLCLSANTPVELNQQIINAFFATEFPQDQRRLERMRKISALEQRNFK